MKRGRVLIVALAAVAFAAAYGVSAATGGDQRAPDAHSIEALMREMRQADSCEEAAALFDRIAAAHPEALTKDARDVLDDDEGYQDEQCAFAVGSDVEVLVP